MKFGENIFCDVMVTWSRKFPENSIKSICHLALIVSLTPKSFNICTLICINLSGEKKKRKRKVSYWVKKDTDAFVKGSLKAAFFTLKRIFLFSSIFICEYSLWKS